VLLLHILDKCILLNTTYFGEKIYHGSFHSNLPEEDEDKSSLNYKF